MITLICGHSRAGKTTYSHRFDGICPVIHLDDVHQCSRVNTIVNQIDGDVVVEGIYCNPKDRKTLLSAYKGNGSRCIFLNTPLGVRLERQPNKIIHSFMRHERPFCVPTYDEGWDEIIIIDKE